MDSLDALQITKLFDLTFEPFYFQVSYHLTVNKRICHTKSITYTNREQYFKNLKLFSVRVKESFEPIVLQKSKQTNKQKTDGFLLFLKAFSWETDLPVTLIDFTVNKQNW